jgi:unsaturated chondroitin disaccharide hydrolase
LAYREHRDPAFLEAAEKAASYFVGALPADLVPPWDFADEAPNAPRDSSATGICANAFLELAEIHPEPLRQAYYRGLAEAMLASLCKSYLGSDKEEGILVHSAYSVPHHDGVDSSVMWGEWFFLRAVSHLTTDPVPIP